MNPSKIVNIVFVFGLIVCLYACKTSKLNRAENNLETNEIIEDAQEGFSLNMENLGVAGNTTVNLLNRIEVDVLNKNPDLVILMVGTNDMLNSRKFVSYEDYSSNLSQIVKSIKSKNSQILMMSSPRVDSMYLYARHDKELFIDTPNVKLQKAKQIVEKIAKENNVLFLDVNGIYKDQGLPVHNQDNYVRNKKNSNTEDGVHLTSLGYKFLAENVYEYLKTQKLLHTYNNIICFGDSLTKGSGAEGAGTMTGENYPSVLYAMLNN